MDNNQVLRSLRYTFDLNDDKMMATFASGGYAATRAEISDWLKSEDDEAFQVIKDFYLATFLNGFINEKRGKREGKQPEAERRLNNNIILRKLKIALNLKDDELLAALALAGRKLSKHELSAFFRKPTQSQYRECGDQVLRNFLQGLRRKHRGH